MTEHEMVEVLMLWLANPNDEVRDLLDGDPEIYTFPEEGGVLAFDVGLVLRVNGQKFYIAVREAGQ